MGAAVEEAVGYVFYVWWVGVWGAVWVIVLFYVVCKCGGICGRRLWR